METFNTLQKYWKYSLDSLVGYILDKQCLFNTDVYINEIQTESWTFLSLFKVINNFLKQSLIKAKVIKKLQFLPNKIMRMVDLLPSDWRSVQNSDSLRVLHSILRLSGKTVYSFSCLHRTLDHFHTCKGNWLVILAQHG